MLLLVWSTEGCRCGTTIEAMVKDLDVDALATCDGGTCTVDGNPALVRPASAAKAIDLAPGQVLDVDLTAALSLAPTDARDLVVVNADADGSGGIVERVSAVKIDGQTATCAATLGKIICFHATSDPHFPDPTHRLEYSYSGTPMQAVSVGFLCASCEVSAACPR